MGKRIYNLVKKNENILALYTLISRIRHGDKKFVHFLLTAEEDPDLLKVIRKGTENYGKVVYLIKECGNGYGFFAEFNNLLCSLYYAESMGFVPHVIWGENFNYYDEKYGIENAFEYFFEPIEVPGFQNSSAIIEKKGTHIAQIGKKFDALGYNRSSASEQIQADMCRKYVHLKKDIQDLLEKNINSILGDGKTLGIHYRGTDFKKGFVGHPVQIDIDSIVSHAKQIVDEEKVDRIFLATDDISAISALKREFGDLLYYYEDVIRSDGETSVAFSDGERQFHKYNLAWEVLRDAYTLSRCNNLIAGLSQVSFAAQTLKLARDENYNKIIVLDNGVNMSGEHFHV